LFREDRRENEAKEFRNITPLLKEEEEEEGEKASK